MSSHGLSGTTKIIIGGAIAALGVILSLGGLFLITMTLADLHLGVLLLCGTDPSAVFWGRCFWMMIYLCAIPPVLLFLRYWVATIYRLFGYPEEMQDIRTSLRRILSDYGLAYLRNLSSTTKNIIRVSAAALGSTLPLVALAFGTKALAHLHGSVHLLCDTGPVTVSTISHLWGWIFVCAIPFSLLFSLYWHITVYHFFEEIMA